MTLQRNSGWPTRFLPPLLGALSLGVRLGVLIRADFMFDDPYITWRVARNLASGLGAVYNVGDHVQASSSLLHMWFCAALWWLFGAQAILIDRICACFADACCTSLIARFVLEPDGGERRSASVLGAVVAALFHALSAQTAFVAPAGLETSFYCCAVLVACLRAGQGRFWTASVAACLATLLRPDGALTLVVVAAVAIRRRALRPLLLAWGALLLPVVLWQWSYYGTVVPQTITAKQLIERSAAEQWLKLCSEFFLGGFRQRGTTVLVALGMLRAWRVPRWRPLLMWTASYASLFSTLASWWPWYWAPLALALAGLLGLGALTVCEHLTNLGLPARSSIGAVCLGALLMAFSLGQHTWRRMSWGHAVLGPLKRQNMAMARWAEGHVPADGNVLTERMGEFGFHTTRRIDDYPGLVSRGVTGALRTIGRPIAWGPSDTGALAAILEKVAPTHLLLRQAEYDVGTSRRILSCYRVVGTFPAEKTQSPVADYQDMFALERHCSP